MRTLFIHLFGVYISIETRDLTTEINRYLILGARILEEASWRYIGRCRRACVGVNRVQMTEIVFIGK
jgi:hypothetical protein